MERTTQQEPFMLNFLEVNDRLNKQSSISQMTMIYKPTTKVLLSLSWNSRYSNQYPAILSFKMENDKLLTKNRWIYHTVFVDMRVFPPIEVKTIQKDGRYIISSWNKTDIYRLILIKTINIPTFTTDKRFKNYIKIAFFRFLYCSVSFLSF